MLCIRPFAGSCNNGAATGDGGSWRTIVIRAVRKFHTNLYIDYDTRLQIFCSVTQVFLSSAVTKIGFACLSFIHLWASGPGLQPLPHNPLDP